MISPVHVDLPLQPVLELLGVFVGALSGGLAAVRKSFDVFGIVVLAWVAGLGGGILRDVLIGAIPPVGIAQWEFVATACAAGLVTWAAHPGLHRLRRLVLVLDAGALALFTVVGTIKALEYGVGATAAVFAGIVTGVGGGVLRDLLTGEVPAVLHQRQLYAIPSLLGALVVVVLWREEALSEGTVVAAVVAVLGIRLVALRFGWQAPGPWDRSAARARLGRVGGVGRTGRSAREERVERAHRVGRRRGGLGGTGRGGTGPGLPPEQPAPLLRWVARVRRSRAAGRGGAGGSDAG
ncbi:trimeric intracellular cation channel family protein [Cellulomonas pakistanensis]|uniref:trimeric intracellular cation channel family protein n=1 Tax=Cellulomonas pakistanensis TaxID=992287 RepID=UPI001943577D|nr:TRIC cation channel family protein [Cellulomonas pakistanensis]